MTSTQCCTFIKEKQSDLVVVSLDEAVDVVVMCCLGVGGVTVSSQSPAGVPVAGQTLLIQVNVHSHVQLKDIKQ